MGLDKELEGTLVVSLEQAVAAPYCGLLLADAGARVIKIERPEGDFARAYDAGANGKSTIFAWLNRGKESVCLDLKHPQDKAVLRAALQRADVFLSNLAPGAVERLGFHGPDLRRDNPGLVTCQINGYGDSGPAAGRKAYDFLVQAESGVCAVTGTPDSPARVGVPLTDLSTGLTAFSAILRALLQRARTGQGCDLRISMFDVMADWMNMPLMGHRYMGGAPARAGLKHTFIAPYGAFACGDGQHVLISVQNDREFTALCRDVLNRPELPQDAKFSTNPARYKNRCELDSIVTACFGEGSSDEIVDRLSEAKIANARLNDVADLSEHPFLRNVEARISGQSVSLAALPVATTSPVCEDVPDLDQHGAALRREFRHKG